MSPVDGKKIDRTTRADDGLSRVDRKRKETRARIIREAEHLMRTSPVDEVTIQDITDAADVGHGTFYLHFKSKYEVLLPVVQQVAEDCDRTLQQAMKDIDDPAEVVCCSARYMGRMVLEDPLWRWMLKHSGMPLEDMCGAIGHFAARDLGRGLLSGRFNLPDLAVATSCLGGAFVNGLLTAIDSDDPGRAIDQVAELTLRLLGISADEARLVAAKSLPDINETNQSMTGEA